MKDIYKHILWVGCIMCVAPLAVRGYMWGKCTDALASGSKAKFTLPDYHGLEHTVVFLGAAMIAIVIIKAICMSRSGKKPSPDARHESEIGSGNIH
ncbi:MAG: hypothetical protein GY809_29065 [Planctomycetes bacterium]|nr:hypothetical protein [Planctomycetota bacterium]